MGYRLAPVLAFAVLSIGLSACSRPAPEPAAASGPAVATPPAADVAAADRAATPVPQTATPASDGPPDAAPSPRSEGATVPERFRGSYAAEGRCGSPGDESRLRIEAGVIRFHESHGRVIRARGDGDSLALTLALTGEGETREADYAFRREDDGRRLVDTENGLARVRCDPGAPG